MALFALGYALLQFPFDILGGYILPKRYGRMPFESPRFMVGLFRGMAVHMAIWLVCGSLIMAAGGIAGFGGTVATGFVLVVLLLATRTTIASLMSTVRFKLAQPNKVLRNDAPSLLLAECDDEGFTGGITGVLNPVAHVLPERWQERLGPSGFELALRRRREAVDSGSWRRGRALAVTFTLIGLAVSAWLAGPDRLGTLAGTAALSLWFSLWSFLGLLVLPTFSRSGVVEVDQRLRRAGYPNDLIEQTTRRLDGMQDDEQDRPPLVEAIFHPIPSVSNRLQGEGRRRVFGAWDAARTAIFLSFAGVGLLGRAVHCNCGRPALWAMLPTD
ncbi:MAG: hypothetical protein AAF961_07450 [Planctomycetota bacterium]